jgi:GWxTD domain-containing protein
MGPLVATLAFSVLLYACAGTSPSSAPRGNGISYSSSTGIFCNANVTNRGQSLQVSLELEVERLYNSALLDQVGIRYEVRPASGGAPLAADSVRLARNDSYRKVNNTFYVTFSLPPLPNAGLLVLTIADRQTDRTLVKEVALNVGQDALPFVLNKQNPLQVQNEVFNHYVSETDTLRFVSAGDAPVQVYRVKRDFLPALPPMQTEGLNVGAELAVDSFFTAPANRDFRLQAKGLYFAQADTTTNLGLGFSVMERNYPRFRRVEHLIEALLYLSTPEELAMLTSSPDRKAALDNFWLKLGGNEENTRRMIKLYYQRVEYANRQFTSYKEGWKTDMGMIYIVFGEPLNVLKSGPAQTWVYDLGNREEVRFTFIERPNQFTGKHSELQRNARYREPWYSSVEKWRLGLVAN